MFITKTKPSPIFAGNHQLEELITISLLSHFDSNLKDHQHLLDTPLPLSHDPLPTVRICEEDVRQVFHRQKIWKASVPDGVSASRLKA